MTYTCLSQTERYQIQVLMKAGHNQAEIAQILGRRKSKISRELTRASGPRVYLPRQAQNRSEERLRCSSNAARISPEIWQAVRGFLALQWNPEQIASHLPVSHETIYQKIFADKAQGVIDGTSYAAKRRRKRDSSGHDRRCQIPNGRSTLERPKSVEQPANIGHWEEW